MIDKHRLSPSSSLHKHGGTIDNVADGALIKPTHLNYALNNLLLIDFFRERLSQYNRRFYRIMNGDGQLTMGKFIYEYRTFAAVFAEKTHNKQVKLPPSTCQTEQIVFVPGVCMSE